MAWTIKRGTHPNLPSVVITIDGYPETLGERTEFRHVQLVFRQGESAREMQSAIADAATDYVTRNPRVALPMAFPAGILNMSGND